MMKSQDTNSIQPNESTYLICEYNLDGNCWTPGEFASEAKARAAFDSLCADYPDKHIELVEQVKTFKLVDSQYPSQRNSDQLTFNLI